MNLWIRSQDREDLINNPLRIYYDSNYEGVHKIIANTYDETIWLGKYKTKERALEVLNEIELALGCKRTAFNNTIVFVNVLENVNSMVYEMPEE